jgi:hypothetical protein
MDRRAHQVAGEARENGRNTLTKSVKKVNTYSEPKASPYGNEMNSIPAN